MLINTSQIVKEEQQLSISLYAELETESLYHVDFKINLLISAKGQQEF